jgi:ParB family chromosome partitioning protein
MSLGKGLESLIPPNKGNQSQGISGSQHPEPEEPEEKLLPGRPEEKELPAPEKEPLLEAVPISELQSQEETSVSSTPAVLPSAVPGVVTTRQDDRRPKDRKVDQAIFYLEVSKIAPNENQPRKHFDEEAIKELAASIREFGILQPIVVTKHEIEVPHGTEVNYELIAGERRLMAAKSLGMERIPAIIRHVDQRRERLELAIIENLQREDLSPVEMARAFARLTDEFRLTQREIASRLGKSRETVANTLRLLDLPTYIQDAIGKGEVSESHGLFLLGIDDPSLQQQLFHELVANRLTIRELRERARRVKPSKAEKDEQGAAPEVKMFEEKLSSELGTPVSIQQKGESGKITINFYSKEELAQIVERMSAPEE